MTTGQAIGLRRGDTITVRYHVVEVKDNGEIIVVRRPGSAVGYRLRPEEIEYPMVVLDSLGGAPVGMERAGLVTHVPTEYAEVAK